MEQTILLLWRIYLGNQLMTSTQRLHLSDVLAAMRMVKAIPSHWLTAYSFTTTVYQRASRTPWSYFCELKLGALSDRERSLTGEWVGGEMEGRRATWLRQLNFQRRYFPSFPRHSASAHTFLWFAADWSRSYYISVERRDLEFWSRQWWSSVSFFPTIAEPSGSRTLNDV